jgi:hypothetical protein
MGKEAGKVVGRVRGIFPDPNDRERGEANEGWESWESWDSWESWESWES